MSHKPKSVREIYIDSIKVNLDTIANQLSRSGITVLDLDAITKGIAELYERKAEEISKEAEADMMTIENAPSPLELLVDCISKFSISNRSLPASARSLLSGYVKTMQDWM